MSIVNQTVLDSQIAFKSYSQVGLNSRKEIIKELRKDLMAVLNTMASREIEQTGMGKLEDKIVKLYFAINNTPGVEDLVTQVHTSDSGMTLYENASYGVACALQPATNPCATLINNTIAMLAAGNSVIHIPHPRCVAVSNYVTDIINKSIYRICGINNLVTSMTKVTKSITDEIMCHPDVALVVATGGTRTVNNALNAPKRVIAAGQANPVAIVDRTADLGKAARDIIIGASFDNNIMCITEKSVVIEREVAETFITELRQNGAYYTDNEEEILKIATVCLNQDLKMNRGMEGKSAEEILKAAQIPFSGSVKIIVTKAVKEHPFVTEELLMPIVPIVEANDFEDALETALFIEQGFRHTAVIHSQSIENLNRAASIMQTAVFIKNGSSLVGIGINGEEKVCFTIANVTGEGVVTARDFARKRRCSLTSGFKLR